ncbi:MAG TPA: hypothetical protein DEO40_01535 [Treponema sp.]|jgi:1-acyl-sn-glycerol-3-phosphate acyltransferase|nr:hypothetical protein [Treponema sp.]HBB43570.1 hypothetical protein [Treponema sp.]HCA19341.1 hypothetical protein [Treponema sp.]
MSKKTKDERYSADDLPPAKNKILYAYRCFIKLFMIGFFSVGAMFIAIVCFPVMMIFIHPHEKFRKAARTFISGSFVMFTNFLRIMGGARFTFHDKEKYKDLRSKIIVANHPSLLDVVYIISVVPHADCIVRGGLTHSPFVGIIKQLYIVNTLGTEEMMELSAKSLAAGNNLIVFPEGTRTPRHGTNPFKRGAARIALETHSDIQMIYIGGNDKYGLGKHDAFFSYNKSEEYHYDVHLLDQIHISEYDGVESQIAARRITEKMHDEIAKAALEVDGRVL